MSKVSDWRLRLQEARTAECAARNAIPEPLRRSSGGYIMAQVTDGGEPVIMQGVWRPGREDDRGSVMTVDDALKLAYWIIENFGEGKDE